MAYYMYCPLDLTVKQQHIYTLLFKKSSFKGNYRVEYTVEQLTIESDKCFCLTEKMVRTIIKQLIEKGYLTEIEKGRKGIPTTYEINVNDITSGNLSVTNVSAIGKLCVSNEQAISTDTDNESNLSVTNVSAIGNELVNHIIKKEKKKENKNIYVAEIVEYLNEKTGKSFKSSTYKTVSCLNARWNEGFTELEEYKTVIDIKCKEWLKPKKGEKNMSNFLRPETLFGTKFESYLNEVPKKTNIKPQEPVVMVRREIL